MEKLKKKKLPVLFGGEKCLICSSEIFILLFFVHVHELVYGICIIHIAPDKRENQKRYISMKTYIVGTH